MYGDSPNSQEQAEIKEYIEHYEKLVDELELPDHTLIFTTNSKGWVKVINLSALLTGSEVSMFKHVSHNLKFGEFLEEKYKPYLFNKGGFFDFDA